LRAAGAGEMQAAVVAMSGEVEASIFATMALKRLGVPNVIAKAGGRLHGAILERIGADRVVYPEREAGIDVAHTFQIPTSSTTSTWRRASAWPSCACRQSSWARRCASSTSRPLQGHADRPAPRRRGDGQPAPR
jgi:hypothetical protein